MCKELVLKNGHKSKPNTQNQRININTNKIAILNIILDLKNLITTILINYFFVIKVGRDES